MTSTHNGRRSTTGADGARAGRRGAAQRRVSGETRRARPSGAPRSPRGPLAEALGAAFDPARHTPADAAAVLYAVGAHPIGHREQLGPALAWALARRPDVSAALAATIMRELGPLPSAVRRGPKHLRRAEARDVVAYVCWLRRTELPHVDPPPSRSHADARKARRIHRGVRRARWFWRGLGPTRIALCTLRGFGPALAWALRRAPQVPAGSWVRGAVMGLPVRYFDRERLTQRLGPAVLSFGGLHDVGADGSPVLRALRNGRLPLDVYGRVVNALRAELGKAPLPFGSEAP